jgi:hypothetical protein
MLLWLMVPRQNWRPSAHAEDGRKVTVPSHQWNLFISQTVQIIGTLKERPMMNTKPTEEKVANPSTEFDKPRDVGNDSDLSHQEEREALDTWEQDARQLMTASNEGMPGKEEGLEKSKNNPLDEVVQAKDKIEKPADNPSQ